VIRVLGQNLLSGLLQPYLPNTPLVVGLLAAIVLLAAVLLELLGPWRRG
jgi:hypothetical protein